MYVAWTWADMESVIKVFYLLMAQFLPGRVLTTVKKHYDFSVVLVVLNDDVY